MTSNVFYMIIIFLFVPSVSAVVQLSIITQVAVNIQVQVLWKRENGDPCIWDLWLLMDGQVKSMATTVEAQDSLSGVVAVVFPGIGQFTLQAIDPNNNQLIASVEGIQVGVTPSTLPSSSLTVGPKSRVASSTSSSATATITSDSTTYSTTSPSTPSGSSTSAPPLPASDAPSPTPSSPASSMPPAMIGGIVGGVIGGVVFLAIGAILAVLHRRRRQNATRRVTFHRDLMVLHRNALPPSIYDPESVPTQGAV